MSQNPVEASEKSSFDNIAMPKEITQAHIQFILDNRTSESLLEHPLFTQSIIVPTRSIQTLIGALRRAVMLREQLCVSAPSGYGKSYALAMAERELKIIFPTIPIYLHVVNNKQVPSIRGFFTHFLETVGIHNVKGETKDLRIRLINHLIDAGRSSRYKEIVFLIDEAQSMDLHDFQFLKDIGNQLGKVELRLVVITMGQDPEFAQVIDKLRTAGSLDLISRFTLRQIAFCGISSDDDLKFLLQQIDEEEYPLGTGIKWPQYFVPQAWLDGFRMQEQFESIKAALCARLPGNSLESGVPARQLFLAFRRFMLDYVDIEGEGAKLPPDIWQYCIDYALIADAAEIIEEGKRSTGMKVKP
jgi:hypothetical protein